MLKITLLVIGKIKEDYIKIGIENFLKRLKSYCRIQVVELADGSTLKKVDKHQIDKIKKEEGERILNALGPNDFKIVLDSRGKAMASEDLAVYLERLMNIGHSSIAFIIGGPFGLDTAVIEAADQILSLSNLTFTHEMVRLIFCEQLYRAYKIMLGEPYHY